MARPGDIEDGLDTAEYRSVITGWSRQGRRWVVRIAATTIEHSFTTNEVQAFLLGVFAALDIL